MYAVLLVQSDLSRFVCLISTPLIRLSRYPLKITHLSVTLSSEMISSLRHATRAHFYTHAAFLPKRSSTSPELDRIERSKAIIFKMRHPEWSNKVRWNQWVKYPSGCWRSVKRTKPLRREFCFCTQTRPFGNRASPMKVEHTSEMHEKCMG